MSRGDDKKKNCCSNQGDNEVREGGEGTYLWKFVIDKSVHGGVKKF